MDKNLHTHNWWNYLPKDLKDLLKESMFLVEETSKIQRKFDDYAFLVFPAAKAYEGFLKTMLHDLGIISDEEFFGKRFRIGRALNPAMEENLRETESVYDKLISYCGGKDLPDLMWETWKEGRNLLFHWFPNEKNAIDYNVAKNIIQKILMTMDLAFAGCKIENR